MADTIGTAYVQIEPSFEGVTPKIESHFSGEGEKSGKSFASGFGSVMGTVGKAMAGAVVAGGTAVAGITKQAVSAFADFQQLEGGVETLFGNTYNSVEEFAEATGISMKYAADKFEEYQNRSQTVMQNADNAYKTAGLSANEYMETVTGFAASLNASLGEYSYMSADYANTAVTDMADNANKMGSSMESIQNAYAGFAKQNFTMLDNLKLGYGGTKEEMQRLMSDAEKLSGMEIGTLDMNNFADVIDAIHIIQDNLGITGTTAKEAGETISGSMAMMQSAWQNVLSAMGTGDSNKITETINQLVESATTFGDNIMPVVEQALQGISQLISELAPKIAAELPNLIQQILPGLLDAGVDIIKALGKGILEAIPDLMPAITDVIMELCDMLVEMLPQLIEVGLQVILQLALGIAQALPELIPAIVDTVLTIAEYLIDNVDLLIDASIALIMGLAEGLINALPKLIEKAPEIVIKLVEAIIRNVPKILQAGIELILMLIKGIVDSWSKVFEVGKQIVEKVKNGFSDKVQEAKEWGKDMIQNFIDGIMAKWNALKESVSKVADTVKSFLGFSEPEEGPLSNFHTFAPDMMDLFAKGITDNIGTVKSALTDAASGIMGSGLDLNTIQSVQTDINPSGVAQNEDRLNRIESLLAEFLPNINQNIYLDTGALVGATAGAYNVALGQIATRGGRR